MESSTSSFVFFRSVETKESWKICDLPQNLMYFLHVGSLSMLTFQLNGMGLPKEIKLDLVLRSIYSFVAGV